ncbi:MarC family protein [Cytophaga aurantiaca]|uniref:MarC family protein n=1 Tax=Cytophaga aurantiaca TaxID=29530 RepID=UPI0003752918|nr:MarC family protein [Cytophaga aurantiaca]
MLIDWSFVLIVFTGLFAIINPIGNAPIFISLADHLSKTQQRAIALKAVTVGFIILAIFVVFGYALFNIFGISIQAFRITGGLLVLKVGFDMINSKSKDSAEVTKNAEVTDTGFAISPLATPILVGPGTLSTAVSFVGVGNKIENSIIIILSSGIILSMTYFVFIYSTTLVRIIGKEALNVVTKIMGLLIGSIGIQMMITSIEELVHNYKL